MYRLLLKVLMILVVALVYYIFWDFPLCEKCFGYLAIGTCIVSCSGMGFLVPKVLCFGGVIAALIQGFTFGSDLGTVNIKLKV